MLPIRALVADDEPLARARLMRLLGQFPDIEVVADCANGGEAIAAMREQKPDIAFLDIQMPDMDGFDVLDSLPAAHHPQVVFVTAHSEHAVRAFEARAVDYLLKPVSGERLRQAVERVRQRAPQNQAALPGDGESGLRSYPARIAVPVGLRIQLVPVDEIDFVSAHANYVELHLGARTLVLRATMTQLEARLDPTRFLRVHRSRMVRLDGIVDVETSASGQFLLRLKSGTRVASGRSYHPRLRVALGLVAGE
ncbi:MAG TPA: LytTR family DNA-binding domain-containing protein [Arenimonas sp.]|uniref:LytR/AlgR family response regulator transcription factor n=1 Tax=Arenimonas sp. TaxID=1872635 RepID=UPI002C800CB7|nr:LytTR family DNA-binding domain-containing protein [Arenimonas sp.]HMB56842.1 LytTR family DNA-binding domain-containing protein [Arenimonas sp.]